jgi:hypothetical protein
MVKSCKKGLRAHGKVATGGAEDNHSEPESRYMSADILWEVPEYKCGTFPLHQPAQ